MEILKELIAVFIQTFLGLFILVAFLAISPILFLIIVFTDGINWLKGNF